MAAGKAAGRILCDPEQGRRRYSPSTMYKDYSINESLFHWQSQSTTAENSATGQRYIHHREKGSRVLLFVREFKADARFGGAGAYTYLGTVNYVKHELPPHEHHMEAGPPDPCKVPQKDQQAGGRLKGEYHEGCSRCRSCDLRRYSDET